MALSDGSVNVEQVIHMEGLLTLKRNEYEQARLADKMACSDDREYSTDAGTLWNYVVVNDAFVRITGCKTSAVSLFIPEEIEGKPVFELSVDACSYLDSVREIVCSPQIVSIGQCAFRLCKSLERLVLPCDVDGYDSSWVRGCTRLSELVLPGRLKRIYANIFDVGELKRLTLGVEAESFVPGVFAKSTLEYIDIDPANPFLTSDGKAIYADGAERLCVLAVPCEGYTVHEGCQVIEVKAFANRGELESVELPDSVIEIGDHAFAYSGLKHFRAPGNLQAIGARAFFRCRHLEDVEFNDRLESIGDEAFTGTALTQLIAPASLENLGRSIAADTQLSFSGEDASFMIAPNGILELDARGGLYRNTPEGKHFVRLLNDEIESYQLLDETVEIEEQAFARHSHIKTIVFSKGLLKIGDAAFRDCRDLTCAEFPPSLEYVGAEAFLDTSLEHVFIPKTLKYLGDSALVTHGAHNGDVAPSLQGIDVEEGSENFFSVPGLLCERREKGGAHVVVYADSVESVHIPDDVTAIDPYAFGGARNLRELFLSTRIRRVGMRGLSLDCLVTHFHIDLAEPIEGNKYFDLYFPESARSAHEIQLAFNLSSSVDPTMIFKHYDSAIVNMHEFDKHSSSAKEEFDAYTQAKLALDRLTNPVLMSKTSKAMLILAITDNIGNVCEAIARHDDREAIDDLVDLELLNKDNLLAIIDRIGKLQDAAMTGYLLEIKRRFFKQSAVDFEL
jgi:hypothetical protein